MRQHSQGGGFGSQLSPPILNKHVVTAEIICDKQMRQALSADYGGGSGGGVGIKKSRQYLQEDS